MNSNDVLARLRQGPPEPPTETALAASQPEAQLAAALQTENAVWVGNIGISDTGLIFPESGVSQDEWAAFANVLRKNEEKKQLVLGDLAAYGADTFKLTYAQIAEVTGYKESSVEIFASVCRNVPQLMRINSLTFSHYQKVSKCDPEFQMIALRLAAESNWSAAQLADYVASKKPKRAAKRTPTIKPIQLIDKAELRRAKKTTLENRQALAQQLRAIADELESF